MPRFAVGDEIVIFYAPENRRCQVMGWSQGTFRALVSPAGRRTLLDSAGRVILGLTANGFIRGARPAWVDVPHDGDLKIVGPTADAQSSADDTSATVDDFMTSLGVLASSLPDRAPADQASEGTAEAYPQPTEEQGAP